MSAFCLFFSEGSTYTANCWGACSETLCNHADPLPCRGVVLLSPHVGVAPGRFLPSAFSGGTFPGPGTHVEGCFLVSADDRWVGPWQDSSEESLNLLQGRCWAGPCLGDCAVGLSSPVSRRGTAQCTSLLLGWWLRTHTFQLFPQYVFFCQLCKDF